ncbi:glycosyltransferase family 4 protein [Hoeflea sp. YIM 152468]|uniref:glycosyltransferase family 4 protein n=1 Tax=Hoeflea sp. YIM 152468 TaxID=3031759 RepID=UPI0023DB86D1|nr:glycosyltransferase family 4 protein [Hoeflea sp. YIM 152468]MDF1609650.1 glycosyltransferase family 4 protein [Hoeflea sp. YIM 152468]
MNGSREMKIMTLNETTRSVYQDAFDAAATQGVRFEQIGFDQIVGGEQKNQSKLRKYLPKRATIDALRARYADFQPDVIQIGPKRRVALAAYMAFRSLPVPMVLEVGNIGSLNVLSPLDHLLHFNSRFTRILAPSRALVNNWAAAPAIGRLIGPERLEFIHHSIAILPPLDPADRDRLRASYGFGPDDFVVGSVCNNREIKNLGFVAGLIGEVGPKAVLALAGAGFDQSGGARIRAAGGDQVRCLGPVPDARRIMSIFDAYVTPTRSPGESFGLAHGEAMQQGVPALCMNIGGSAEMIEHGVSGAVLPAARQDWIHTLRRLNQNAGLRRQIGEAAAARIKSEFSPEAIGRNFIDFFQRLSFQAR